MLQLARMLEIDAICACANDFGAISAAYVAEQLGLGGHDGYDTSLLIHHKDLFKKYALSVGIPTPFAQGSETPEKAYQLAMSLQLPLIIKPVDLTGGKGITTVNDSGQLQAAIDLAFSISRVGRIVIEEYFHGSQHSFSTFLVNQRVVFHFSDNEYSYKNPYLVSTSSAPASNIDSFREELLQVANTIASSLDLVDGLLHFQYLASEDEFTILEITRRCSGDLYPLPVNCSSGLNWTDWIIQAESGADCSDFPLVEQSGYCGRHCIMAPGNGKLKDIVIDESLKPNITEKYSWWKSGDVIDNYLVQKFGVLLLEFASLSEMQEKTANIHELVKVELA